MRAADNGTLSDEYSSSAGKKIRFGVPCLYPKGTLIDLFFIARAFNRRLHAMREKEPMTADRPGKITFGHLVSLGSRLTDRDRQIALDCHDHHVLTTEQLVRLHFAGLRTATARLDALYKLRVLDRFRPPARQARRGQHPVSLDSR